jgi:cobalt-zinc-cadmium efflux system outer membrane protein
MFVRYVMILCIAAPLGFVACASHKINVPPKRPLWSDIPAYQAPRESQEATPTELREPSGELWLSDALALALLYSPKLADFAWSVRITEARSLQAGLRPNPELEIEVEEFGGLGPRKEFDGAETSIYLSQLVELGGERGARKRVAGWENYVANADYEAERLAVLTDATLGFIDVVAAQELLRLAEDLHRISEETFSAVIERVKAGKVSPIEETKASIELANKEIDLISARSDLVIARKRLASVWGSTSPQFTAAAGSLDEVKNIPSVETLEALIDKNPELIRWAGVMERRLAELALERAERVFDITLSVGVKRFEESGDYAFTMGLGLPLPIFDRNQGGVGEARSRLAQSEQQTKAARVRIATALSESYEALASARDEANSLAHRVVPAAGEAFEAARRGYRQGKFGYLEVLDAQRTFAQTTARLLDAQARYHRAAALVESLTGTRLDSIIEGESSQLEEKP